MPAQLPKLTARPRNSVVSSRLSGPRHRKPDGGLLDFWTL